MSLYNLFVSFYLLLAVVICIYFYIQESTKKSMYVDSTLKIKRMSDLKVLLLYKQNRLNYERN